MSTPMEHLSYYKHKDLKFTALDYYPHAEKITINPIYNSEIIKLSRHFPIVFPGPTSSTPRLPAALFALSANHKNSFVDSDGMWLNEYIPAHIRCYPFALTKVDGFNKDSLLVDVDAPHFKKANGALLFNSDGTPAKLLQDKINFFANLKREEQETEFFIKLLEDAGLLVAKKIVSNQQGNGDNCYSGFLIVDQKKMASLDAERFLKLRQHNVLPLIYAHLASLDRFKSLTIPLSPPPTLNPVTNNIIVKERDNLAEDTSPPSKPQSKPLNLLQSVATHLSAALIGAILIFLTVKPSHISNIETHKPEKTDLNSPATNINKKVEVAKIEVEKPKKNNILHPPQTIISTIPDIVKKQTIVEKKTDKIVIPTPGKVHLPDVPPRQDEDYLDQERQNPTTESRLKAAEADILANRLTQPIGNSAVEKILPILAKDPDHPYAKKLLAKIIARYEELTKIDISKSRLSTPYGHNALQKIKIIRSLDANSRVAKNLQVYVAEKYASLAHYYLHKDLTKGSLMLNKAIKLAPKNDTVARVNELYKLN
jgi:hypothetical protein